MDPSELLLLFDFDSGRGGMRGERREQGRRSRRLCHLLLRRCGRLSDAMRMGLRLRWLRWSWSWKKLRWVISEIGGKLGMRLLTATVCEMFDLH